jgi:two-component system cell cycle response regulator DivK
MAWSVTMSSPFSFEYLADIRDGARRMVERTRAHEGDLNELVETAEGVARHATALAVALTRAETNADGLSRLCSDQARLSVDNAAATVRACGSAREQHVAAHRLYRTIEHGPADPHEIVASRAAAVLVVDDVEDVRDLIALVLRNAGFVVRTAVNGLEGLLTAYEMRPDVIIMDLTMPVLNGIEATRLIKATRATRESRVIAYTGDGSIPPLIERWFVAIVSKPSPPDAVLAAVQNAVSQ